jgi:hypothetical protein
MYILDWSVLRFTIEPPFVSHTSLSLGPPLGATSDNIVLCGGSGLFTKSSLESSKLCCNSSANVIPTSVVCRNKLLMILFLGLLDISELELRERRLR